MGRVKRLLEMREQYAQRRKQQGTAQFTLQDAERSGKLVAEAKNLSYAIGGKTIVRNFSTTVLRGDKIGIIGPNGAGKRSEEHTSELQSLMRSSYAVFCLKNKNINTQHTVHELIQKLQ